MPKILVIVLLILFTHIVSGQIATKIQIGSAQISADVDATVDPLNAAQLSVIYDIHDNFSLSGSTGFMTLTGTDSQAWFSGSLGGGLIENFYMPDHIFRWYPSFSSKLLTFSVNGIGNLNIIKNRLTAHIGGGIGIANASSYVDLLDENLEHYDLSTNRNWTRDQLNSLYDGIYETRVDDLSSWIFNIQLTGGLEVNLNESLSLCADYTRYILTTDYLDGIKYRNAIAQTGNNDGIQFISLGLKMKFISYDDDEQDIFDEE